MSRFAFAKVKHGLTATADKGGSKLVRKYTVGIAALDYMRGFEDATTYPVASVGGRPDLHLTRAGPPGITAIVLIIL